MPAPTSCPTLITDLLITLAFHQSPFTFHLSRLPMRFTRLPILVVLFVLSSALTRAAEIRVVSSEGFAAAYRTLAPQFEKTTGNHLITGWGPSIGNTRISGIPSHHR